MKAVREYETVDEFLDPASVEAALEDVDGFTVDEKKPYSNRLEEIG